MTSTIPTRPISFMAAGDLRDALTALQNGNAPAAVSALMAIDQESWEVIEDRLAAIGSDIHDLLTAAENTPARPLPTR